MRIVICGGGKVGEYLAQVLLDKGNEVSIIERNTQIADRLSMILTGRYLVINGDGCDSKFQADAGVGRADVFVSTTGQDDNNLVACEIAQRVFHVARCVARVNAPKNQRIFRALNIESVSSTQLIATLIQEEASLGSMTTMAALADSNVTLTEISLPKFKNADILSGVAVGEIPMPDQCLIVAVLGDAGVEVAMPYTIVLPGNKVYVIANKENIADAREILRSL